MKFLAGLLVGAGMTMFGICYIVGATAAIQQRGRYN